jgi:hypothetical protein
MTMTFPKTPSLELNPIDVFNELPLRRNRTGRYPTNYSQLTFQEQEAFQDILTACENEINRQLVEYKNEVEDYTYEMDDKMADALAALKYSDI